MMSVADLLFRGGAVAVLLLLITVLLARFHSDWAARFGALFAFGVASYILISSPETFAVLGSAQPLLIIIAICNPVVFWLFVNALFDDNFEWRGWYIGPSVLVIGFGIVRVIFNVDELWLMILYQLVVFALMIQVLFLAIRDLNNDLVLARRRFRVVLAGIVGSTIIIINIVELFLPEGGASVPDSLRLFQALTVLTLAFGFTIALTLQRDVFFRAAPYPMVGPQPVHSTTHQGELSRLEQLMTDGFYKKPSLTVGVLAEEMRMQEHQLRKLINQELGYRNFTAFLNLYRIDEAKRELANPDLIRKQVVQIAFDIGYGSLPTFNRAFKGTVGVSPTEYRRAQLQSTSQN